jgi:hypothetical protein
MKWQEQRKYRRNSHLTIPLFPEYLYLAPGRKRANGRVEVFVSTVCQTSSIQSQSSEPKLETPDGI